MRTFRIGLLLSLPVCLGWLAVAPAACGSVTLVPAGSVWKYLDTGADPGGGWTTLGFNDSSWLSGRAQLGYGEGDEATVVSGGPVPGPRYITTYFRHTWVMTNAASCGSLTLRLLYDDGAAVCLNGLEICRVALPPGPITSSTLATVNVREDRLFSTPLMIVPPGLLVNGSNVLAVEIHQVNSFSTDISFDLELSDEPPALTSILDLAATNAAFVAPASLSLTAKAASEPGVTNLKFYVNGVWQTNRSMFNNLYASFACAFGGPTNCTLALSAHDKTGAARTSRVEVVVEPGPAPGQMVSLVGPGSQWKFLDDGADLGNAWRSPGFNDGAWLAGPAMLGHGRPGIATPTRSDTLTTYFRHAFEVAEPSLFGKLVLRVLRDDGVKVYLNGADVFRNNLPSEPVTFATPALEAVMATGFLSGPCVEPSLLIAGRNVLAVEIHKTTPSAAVLAFDLELSGIKSATAPRLTALRTPTNTLVIIWQGATNNVRLFETPSLSQTNWTEVSPQPEPTGQSNKLTVPLLEDQRFYRLQKN